VATIVEIPKSLKHSASAEGGTQSTERRREPRYPANDPATVQVLPGRGAKIGALLTDVSRSGVCLRLKTFLQVNSSVKIWLQSKTVMIGKVRYCRRRGTGFDAGILIEDLLYDPDAQAPHLHDDEICLYLGGKRVTVAEVIRLKNHLGCCESCRRQVAETNAALFAARRPR
jgi:hypothetical protein